ncbi:glutathione hydrolase 1 proenzyme-like [Dreissena polymorpha]|uniref:Uncharacterized protein n=1 Tax=Dreissena polymorpha TaxID=45954 RepID=A0A9D4N3P1_DREPO|nr:glutathione hydrolase 1 proenzyme-like [Dreissena polymorpha]KAH3886704.1 hypothetical protein DPMN_010717 [Dreissena polymorpha]
MASEGKYDELREPQYSGDKSELLDDSTTNKSNIPHSESNSSSDHSAHKPLTSPNKILEAEKAVLQDQSRGLRIIIICAFVFSLVITVALILSIYLGPPQIGANAAISSDVRECSDIGLQMLNKGGNAVDAAVAAMFCLGVVNAESSGLGGGGFMLVHDHKVEKSEVFDFRETAPSQARPEMYKGSPLKQKLGALAVAVPGELKGMEAAHQKYGKLPWKTVVSPAANLARNGFHMTGHTEFVLNSPKLNLEAFMQSKIAPFYIIDGKPKKTGDLIVRKELAETLDKIATEGSAVFYSGGIADSIVKELVNAGSPGIVTKDDLANYEVQMRSVVKTTYKDYTVESVPAPGSGPVVLSIMNFMEGYLDLMSDAQSYHLLLEAFKFGYAQRGLLGDPKFNTQAIENATTVMISKEEAARLRNITTNQTRDASFYSSSVHQTPDAGTSHLSVIDTAELMVSVTSTINDWFGSMVLTDTGILLNNQMADFGLPGTVNEIRGGKRPQSSMSPTVVYETGHLCGLRMACGAANGTRIITGIAEVLFNNLTLNYYLEKSVSSPRMHSDLYPNASLVEVEDGFPGEVLTGLKAMGHAVQGVPRELSAVNVVLKIKDNIEAVADQRKAGSGTAWFK